MRPRQALRAIVLVSGLMGASAQAATIQVAIDKLVYIPAEENAKVGDTIEWINKDVIAHTATARNGDWDVTIAPGKSARVVLKKAGTVDYYCRFHPNMKARMGVAP